MGSSVLLLLKLALLAAYYTPASVASPARPAHCIKKCGNVDISYPFGMKHSSCFKDPDFQINCKHNASNGLSIPYLAANRYKHHIQVLNISEDTSEIYVSMPVSYVCYDPKNSNDAYQQKDRFQMPSKFGISNKNNKFFVRGCETYAILFDRSGKILNGCQSMCSDDEFFSVTSNNGTCQSDLGLAVANYTINIFFYYSNSSETRCSYAFVAENGSSNYSDPNDFKKIRETNRSTVVLDWAVDNTNTCGGACKGNNTECVKSESVSGHYVCRCKRGFLGNPYRDDGCKDVDECKDSNLNKCLHPKLCRNTDGDYKCSCPRGQKGNGRDETVGGSGCRPMITIPLGCNACLWSS